MTLFAYLDEFGHIGPYVGRQHPRYKESPVFGLAGFVLPAKAVRDFGSWFFQRKCELLAFEIERSGEHPALWEKKGASLYTLTNVTRYLELLRSDGFLVPLREKRKVAGVELDLHLRGGDEVDICCDLRVW